MSQAAVERTRNPFRGLETKPETEALRASTPDSDAVLPAPELVLREMTGFEEEAIERAADHPNSARLVNEILARCLVAPGEDHRAALEQIRRLLVADRDVALVRLRQMSLGDAIESEVACPSCAETMAARFALSDLALDVSRPPERIRASLPDGRVAVMRLPTAGDQEDLLDQGLELAAERRTFLLARLILAIDTAGPLTPDNVRALPTQVRFAIEAAIDDATPALDLTMGVACSACGHDFSVPLDVDAFFFSR
jgi:hypothetical protein